MQKTSIFFEIRGVFARARWEKRWTSADKTRGGQFFAILCGRLL